MLPKFPKLYQKNKKFLLILSSGRCGSTSVLNELNSHSDFNIYGENYGTINNLLKSVLFLNKTKNYISVSNRLSTKKYSDKNFYLGTEWYNDPNKIKDLSYELCHNIIKFFESTHLYIGYKEIRFNDIDLSYLNILEKLYNVKYIYLTRDIEQQAQSMYKLKWFYQNDLPLKSHDINSYKEYIATTNNNISNFLIFKGKKQFIHKDISKSPNFAKEIYENILHDK